MQNIWRFQKKSYLCNRNRERKQQKLNGALVQLVRIHACHAWGHGFESRTHRERVPNKFGTLFYYTFPVIKKCSLKLMLHQTPTEYRNNLKLHHNI